MNLINAEHQKRLDLIKQESWGPKDGDKDWLIARLEAEPEEELRLSVLATRYNDERIAAELAYEGAIDKATEFEGKWKAAEARAEDLEALFRLQRTRMTEATKVWRETTHQHDVSPDLGDLLAWLLSAREALTKAVVLLAVPYEGLLLDSESRRWIAPALWAAIEEGVKAARPALPAAGGGA
jgi:hypothetical protein